MRKGLIHIYYGDGKGKTTCALGMALRALGNGLRVQLYQFLKDAPSGEVEALRRFERAEVFRAGAGCGKFLWQMDREEREAFLAAQRRLLHRACACAVDSRADLLILDEILSAGDAVGPQEILELLSLRAPEIEIVLTGHQAPPSLLAAADYVTFLQKQKHPYDRGVSARRGIEY